MKECDLILLSWNQTELLRSCIESILACTKTPSRLIIVDNASGAETLRYLKSVKGNETVQVEILYNDTNDGFAKGMNRGMRISDAPFVCLMNNDTVVTDGWLTEMIKVAESSEDIGVVNPDSNTTGTGPAGPDGLEEFLKIRGAHAGYGEMATCIGFCMLIKRCVINKIGYLNEGIGRFNYEDTDYSLSAKKEGYRCVLAKGSYVYHYISSSLKMVKGIKALSDKNRERFETKWGRALRIFFVSSKDACDENNGFKDDLRRAVMLIGMNNFVYFVYRDKVRRSRGDLFEMLGMPEHGSLAAIPFAGPRRLFGLFCLFRVLKRLKKRYNIILAKEPFKSMLEKFTFFHNAEVFDSEYNFKGDELWKKRFQFQ